MKTIAQLLLAAVLLAPAARAQVAAPAPEKPKAACPCDQADFKPLTDKGRAVDAYWDARREYKTASTIAGTAALFALLARDNALLNEAQNSLSSAQGKLSAARMKAEALGGITVPGGDDALVVIKLQKGVDY